MPFSKFIGIFIYWILDFFWNDLLLFGCQLLSRLVVIKDGRKPYREIGVSEIGIR